MNAIPTLPQTWQAVWRAPELRDRPALITAERAWTYRELDDAVRSAAGGLRRAGVQPGDYVALALERGPAQVMALLACIAAGACPCPLEPRIAAEETARRVQAVGLRWIVHDGDNAACAAASGLAPAHLLAWDALQDAPPYWAADPAPGDAALLLFTSGSTGKPKGVLLSHRGLARNTAGILAHTALGPQDVLLHLMPLHHTNAINNQVFAPLACGAAIALAERFRAEALPQVLSQFQPTILTGVPTMYARMLQQTFAPDAFARLRLLRCGSAPITTTLHREIEAFTGCELVVSYGLSEATCTSTMNPPGARRIGTVGTVLAGQAVALLDAAGNRVPDGAEGEICIGGDALMLGYLGHEGDDPVRDGWLRTGDLGRFDAEGYLSITGRIKEVIIRGGENLSPKLIEDVLVTLPGIAACCVVAQADADLGEVPVAVVVAAADAAPPADADIRALVQARLGRIYVPQAVYLREALPENAVGKVDRKALAQWVQAQAAERALAA
ncbi:class I adenylate-forming enzyme family protein [Bordetella genomosp. 1]|uniref:Acid--CoA ligase n=1 Tax=Bordetella genomosp. 1 TaxID=1395607 RepID=A0ABX4ET21_9BORD|nr:class I adenylate-forming enzyme family protein [Bordetella genomosp. 1]OZI55774.1 acid--CoA ligase [Bordetella genomosp. 1]